MIVFDLPSPAFERFLAVNANYWHSFAARRKHRTNGNVLVELLHNNGSVLMSNILVGRHVAELLNADLMGVVAPNFTGYPVPVKEVTRLAQSFGIERVHLVSAEEVSSGWSPISAFYSGRSRWRASRAKSRLRSLSGDVLRQAVLGLRAGDIPVGDLIYDSFLHAADIGTFDDYDERLGREVDRAHRFFAEFEMLFREFAVRAAVVSHTVYVDYGILTRVTLRHGGSVFGKTGLDPFWVRRYIDMKDADQFAGHLDIGQVNALIERFGNNFLSEAVDFFPPRPTADKRPDFFRYGYGDTKTELSRTEILQSLDLDANLKTCVIMAHQFTDAVHSFPGALFPDYYQWLDALLDFTAGRSDVNFLIKQHPYEVLVGQNEYFRSLISKHQPRHKNLRVVPDNVATSSLFTCATAMTTVNGTSGLEFAAAGVPCILAGNPFYGDFEFAVRPKDQKAYLQAVADFSKLQPLANELIALAKAVALAEFKYTWVSSSAVPPIGDLAGIQVGQEDLDAFWLDAADRIARYEVEADPLYRNLARMIDKDQTVLLNCEGETSFSPASKLRGDRE